MDENNAQRYVVKPVLKALQVLVVVGEERRPLALKEICYRVRLPKTTVFRYLQTLAAAGFVTYDVTQDVYHAGHRLFELGQLAGEQLRIRDVALPFMRQLREQFNETVNLGILDGLDVVYVEMVESHRSLRMQATLGSRDPSYSTALGKAMLAYVEPSQWEGKLPAKLAARTHKTLATAAELKANLAVVRKEGFALDDGENEDGARCVGAPIFDSLGQVKAAVSVSAPASRMDDARLRQVAQMVREVALAISRQLGFVATVDTLAG
jgi:DNA-binding IclR family transcriptional regulator